MSGTESPEVKLLSLVFEQRFDKATGVLGLKRAPALQGAILPELDLLLGAIAWSRLPEARLALKSGERRLAMDMIEATSPGSLRDASEIEKSLRLSLAAMSWLEAECDALLKGLRRAALGTAEERARCAPKLSAKAAGRIRNALESPRTTPRSMAGAIRNMLVSDWSAVNTEALRDFLKSGGYAGAAKRAAAVAAEGELLELDGGVKDDDADSKVWVMEVLDRLADQADEAAGAPRPQGEQSLEEAVAAELAGGGTW